MAGEIVHDHNVAVMQRGAQNLLHIGLEYVAIDWAAEHEGGDEPAQGQRAHEGRRLPMPVRNPDAQSLAA